MRDREMREPGPSLWAGYLLEGDETTLGASDLAAAKAWLRDIGALYAFDCSNAVYYERFDGRITEMVIYTLRGE